MSNVGLVLLAAGASTRMGTPKQLLPIRGRPLIRHAAEVALAACRPVFVVLGAGAGEIRPALRHLPVEILENPRWREGIGTSVHCAVRAAVDAGLEAIILALADQPEITAESYRRLVRAHRAFARPVVASCYAGTVGVPALFTHGVFAELLALDPHLGCKSAIQANPGRALLLDCPEAAVDLDTPADYEALLTADQRK